jgi:hypothetical protein
MGQPTRVMSAISVYSVASRSSAAAPSATWKRAAPSSSPPAPATPSSPPTPAPPCAPPRSTPTSCSRPPRSTASTPPTPRRTPTPSSTRDHLRAGPPRPAPRDGPDRDHAGDGAQAPAGGVQPENAGQHRAGDPRREGGDEDHATAPWGGARLQHLTTYDRNRHVVFSRRSLFAGNKTVLGLGFHANTEEVLSGLSGPRPTDVHRFRGTRPLRVRLVTIRFPLLFALFSLVPLFVLARRLPRRVRGGHCPTCGYDLRATPGRCPECGMVSDVKVKAT